MPSHQHHKDWGMRILYCSLILFGNYFDYGIYKCKMLGHEILKCLWNGTFSLTSIFCSSRELQEDNFKSDSTQTFPDTYSNQQYAIFRCKNHQHRLMIPQTNILFLGLPDYKVLDSDNLWDHFSQPAFTDCDSTWEQKSLAFFLATRIYLRGWV